MYQVIRIRTVKKFRVLKEFTDLVEAQDFHAAITRRKNFPAGKTGGPRYGIIGPN